MTVSSEVSSINYAGDGVTLAFAIPFNFLANSDIEVATRDASGDSTVISVGFTITGAGTGSGTATFTVAPASGTHVVLSRAPTILQPVDYVSNDKFPAETTETALDRGIYISQFIRELLNRCIQVPAGDGSIGAGMLLDGASTRASKFLGFDTAGNLDLASSLGSVALTSSLIGTTLDSLKRTAQEISAGITPTNYAYPPGDVRRYNVKGDNATDDTAAINNAFKVGYYGTVVFFQPTMICVITNLSLSVANTNIPPIIYGNGATLKAKAGSTGVLLKIENPHSAWPSFKINGFTADGNNLSTTVVEVHGSQRCTYQELNIYGAAAGTGVAPDGCGLYTHSEASFGIYYCRFERIQCGKDSSGGSPAAGANAKYGFYEYGPGPQYRNNANVYIDCYARENGAEGWYGDYCQNQHLNCAAELNLKAGATFDHTAGMSWDGGYLEANNGVGTLTFTGAFVGGETSGTLTTKWVGGGTNAYSVTFSNGDVRSVTLTNQATTATWASGLTGAATATPTFVGVDLHITTNTGGFWWRPERVVTVVDPNDAAFWDSAGNMFLARGAQAMYYDTAGRLSPQELRCRAGGIAVNNATPPANGIGGLNTQDFHYATLSGSNKLDWKLASGYNESLVGFQFDKAVVFSRATVTYSASMTPDASLGYFQEITATNGTAFTINAPSNPTAGQEIAIVLRNTSGGALGAITLDALYHVSAAFPSPANGNNRTVKFYYNGTNWKEVSRVAADVPN